MKNPLRLIFLAAFAVMSWAAFAQTDAQTDPHHPATGAAEAVTPAPAVEPVAGEPEDMMGMMGGMMPMMEKMMPMMEKMIPMMERMMPMMERMQGGQDGMMQGGMMGDMPMDAANMSDASKAFMDAMKRMDGPMMQGIQADDPDVAFVQAMIPHHQGAIDMARAVLQFGNDDQVKAWANQIIAAQEAEIAAMQDWLKNHAK